MCPYYDFCQCHINWRGDGSEITSNYFYIPLSKRIYPTETPRMCHLLWYWPMPYRLERGCLQNYFQLFRHSPPKTQTPTETDRIYSERWLMVLSSLWECTISPSVNKWRLRRDKTYWCDWELYRIKNRKSHRIIFGNQWEKRFYLNPFNKFCPSICITCL